jgi:hypothetical protein
VVDGQAVEVRFTNLENHMDADAVEKIKAALRAMPDPERAKALEDALVDLPADLLHCFFPTPTSTELDMKSIMNRTRITATVTPASPDHS